jgi:hypothetical protein
MAGEKTILILSDIHYACEAEKARRGHETVIIANPALRLAMRAFRHFIWQRDPFGRNRFLDAFLARAGTPDLVVANGDYSCDTAFVGVSDAAACESARQCLAKLRSRFGPRFLATLGDHELGKTSLFGGRGGPRLASWAQARDELGLGPFWQYELGRWRLIGVTSTLLALPVYEPECLPAERNQWRALREAHLAEIRAAFARLPPDAPVLLFCHDPTALPFLYQEATVRERLSQVTQTMIGHLHSNLILWKSRLLAGMPPLRFLGNSVRRMSSALRDARVWPLFKVRLCPALGGIQLLKDGGYYELTLDPDNPQPPRFRFHRLPQSTGLGRPLDG